MTLSPTELTAVLRQFSGSIHYYHCHPGLLLTDGAKFLAEEAGCYWLYDVVWSVLRQLPEDWFAVVKLTVELEKENRRSCH